MTIYAVRRGDSLYRIAKRFGVDARQLARDNGMERPELLSVGQTIIIPEPKSVYQVREGDTLYSVAQQFSVRVGDLWRNNPFLGGGQTLRAGDLLTIVGEEPMHDREISVNTYVYPSADRAVLRTMLPYLTYLTVMGYGVEEDGTLIEAQGDDEIVELAREYGVAPIAQIAGAGEDGIPSGALASAILGDERAADTLMAEIETLLAGKRYRGVEMAFDGLSAELSDAYGAWLARLGERLSENGRTMFVSLSPRTEEMARDWYGGVQDFESIGDGVDGANLATYGWGYAYGEPQAVSPMTSVRDALDYATKRVPPEMLTLGISQYGYEWTLPHVAGEGRARPIDYETAMALAREKRAAIEYDVAQAAPYLRWFERDGDRTREHVTWFEDARSIAARLALIEEYGLGGVNLWNGMQYWPQLWYLLSQSHPIRKVWE